jgi:hypothetical protein
MLLKNKTKTAFREIGGFFVSFFKELIQLSVTILSAEHRHIRIFTSIWARPLAFKTKSNPLQSQFFFEFRFQIHQLQ